MDEVDRLAEFSPDFAGVLDDVAAALHRIQLKQLVTAYEADDHAGDASVVALANAMAPETVQLFYQIALTGRRDLPLAPTPRAGFEMTLLRMLAFRPGDTGKRTAAPVVRAAPGSSKPASRPESGVAHEVRETAPKATSSSATAADSNAIAAADSSDWPGLIEAAGLRGPLGQLAQHAALIGIENGVVRLALKAEFVHLSSPPLIAQMQEKLGKVLGCAIKVQFEKAVPATVTPADILARKRDARQQAAEEALSDDPFVQTLIRDFDAHVIPDSIRGN